MEEIDQQFLLSKEWKSTEDDIFARVSLLVSFFACKAFWNHRSEAEEVVLKRFDCLLKETLFGEGSEGLLQGICESNLSSVCGKILRNGEPAYCCRDCETDPTCVLCMDCFEHSEHRQHHYKLITSSGSGCCDCGDPEAWNSGVHCKKHQPSQTSSKDNQMDQLSPQLVARAQSFLKVVLTFCQDILCLGEDDPIPSACLTKDVQKLVAEQQYVTVLYNDEVHSYDDVIGALTRPDVGLDQMGAVAMATNVDSLGRGFTCIASREECEKQKVAINKRLRLPLTVKVFPSVIISLQKCALYLLMWTKELTENCSALRHVISEVLLDTGQSEGEEKQSILDCFFVKNSSLWIAARMGWQTLIMTTIFLDPEHKKDLAISLAKNFSCVLSGYFEDSHHYEVSAANLTVQLFTVPSLCHMLVAEHNLLKTVLQTLYDILTKFKNTSTDKLLLAQRGYSSGRMAYIIADMRYVLRNRPTTWSPSLRTSFVESYQVFLKILDLIQSTDPVKRQHYQHVVMEPEWETLFNLCILLLEVIEQVVEWCQSDSSVLHQTVRLTFKQIETSCRLNMMRFKNHPVSKTIVGHDNMELIEFDIQQESVSIHQPLPRLLAGLLTGAHKHNTTIPGLLQTPVTSSRQFLFLAELPLRVIVMTSQVLAGMWKRNGYSLINQTINYRYHSCRTQMYDKDLLLLQSMAAVMDTNKFLYALIYRFRLENWISTTIDYDPVERKEPNSDAVRFLLSEAEEFFYLLITIFGERFIPGVSDVTQADCLKQEIIHQLYIAPLSHSELLKNLKLHEDKELKKIVLEVAEFKKPTSTSKGQYTLKPELEKQFNPFFYHYSKVQLSKAEEAHRKKVKAKGGAFKIPSMPPPKPPQFLTPFQGILRLVQCPVLHQVLHSLFSRAATPGLKYWSDKLLHEAVYLCGLMLLEESPSENNQFSCYAAGLMGTSKGGSILSLLETILQHKRGEEFCYLTQWVVQQLKLVRDSGGRGQQQASYDEMDTAESDSQKEDASKEQKQQQAAAQRRKVMAEMAALQKKFLQSNRQVLSEIDTGANVDQVATSPTKGPMLLAVGLQSVVIQTQTPIPLHCILCQAVEKDAADCEKQFVLGMRIQRSTVLKRTSRAMKPNKEVAVDYLLNNVTLTQGVYSSSCGHGMHMECWRRFHDSRITELRQSDLLFQRRSAVNYESGEFLCPLCQYYCNTTLPIHPDPLNQRPATTDSGGDTEVITFEQWRTRLHTLLDCALSQSSGSTSGSVRAPANSTSGSISNSLAELFPKYLKLERPSMTTGDSYSRTSSTSSQGGTASSYSQAVFTRGYNTYPNEADARVPVSVWATCAYTIQCLECQSEVSGKSLLTSLHSRQVNCLRAMVRAASCATSVCPATDPAALAKHLSKLLSTVVPVGGCFSELPCVLDLDPFSILVNLHFSIISLLDAMDPEYKMALRPLIAIDDQYIVRITVAMQLVQYLLTVESHRGEVPQGSDSTGVVDLWQTLHNWALGSSCDKDQSSTPPSAGVLLAGCRDAVLPLLQRAALFFHCCNGVELPQEDPIPYEALLQYLSLPTQVHNILTADHEAGLNQLVQTWCQHRGVVQQISSLQAAAPPLPCMLAKVQPLYSLPQDYSELIKKASNFRCPKFQSSNRDNTAVIMCLICGELLCSNCYRCMVPPEDGSEAIGNFTNHVRECGGSVGMGLWILECYVVLMNAMDLEDVRGCILPAPYLDEYGESDIGLRSGNPLRLNDDLWKEFQMYWYQHTIIEKITSTNDQERKFVVFSWSKL